LTTYPNTKYADEAAKKIAICQERLAQNQFYVGRFYYKQEAYPAAVHRFEQLLAAYPNDPVAADSCTTSPSPTSGRARRSRP
jgi:outer membrane protein assembly factor BamD